MQAPNGAWVTPAFALSRSKLDELLPLVCATAPASPHLQASMGKIRGHSRSSHTPSHWQATSAGHDASIPSVQQPGNAEAVCSSTCQDPRTDFQAQLCKATWFTHVVFDCDGVLVDSEKASCEALRRAILEVTGEHPASTVSQV